MSSSSSPCAACKLLRRKCTQGCVFAPYFPPDQPSKFANVHKVFGASNVSKLLNELNASQREDAVNSLAYEAEARLQDPVYGCVAYISILQHRIRQTREEIANARKELAGYIGNAAYAPVVPVPNAAGMHPGALAQYAAMGLHPQHPQQQMLVQQQVPHHHQQYNQLHQQQIVDAQHMAAAVEAATRGQHQHQQDMMMMRQGYAPPQGVPTVAIVPPGPGSANPAAYGGAPAQFLIQQQQQPTPSALTTFRTDQQSPPPQSSGHSHVDMSHAPQHRQHTDGSDEGSGGAPPSA
ncbi:LOB domain-containing protein 36-like [Lolium rigidum]|uniref:LOB domain-containing protein 36-like n=1 Tax=Lolium rigidum TaxID=89674 RepID=UPI001F5D06CE|nr:LOB domain-containing protein 36-like [Lolium rigidum]